METLRQAFKALDQLVFGSLEYMIDHLGRDASYQEGFFASILFLAILFGLARIVPYALARVTAYFSATQPPPPPQPVPAPAETGIGCLGGGLVLLGLLALFGGMAWGVMGG